MQVTIQTICDSAIDLADMRNSAFINQDGTPGSELIRYANMAYRDLYSQIVLSKEFYFTTTYPLSIVQGTFSYSLPSDFYKLDGVDLALDTQGRYLTLRPFQFIERNKYRSGFVLTSGPFGLIYRYILVGNQIQFVPSPSQAANVVIWYTPEPAVITGFAQILSIPISGDEYMSLYIARMMLAKEESDTTAIDQKRLEVIKQLTNSLKDRDQGSAAYVVDESSINAGAIYPFRTFNG